MADQDPVRFDGRVAVVTGAGRGLGREIARFLADRGAAVVVNDVGVSRDAARYAGAENGDAQLADAAPRVAAEIEAAGGRAVANTGDVADPEAAASIVDDARRAFGRIDIVMNNAAIIVSAPWASLTPADLTSAWDVNVAGVFNVTRAAWPYLREQGYGRVLNVTGSGGMVFSHPGSHGLLAYDMTKGAVAGITKAMATEGVPLGILVNGFLPTGRSRMHDSTPGTHEIDYSAAHVSPVAAWLLHEGCDTHGRFFAVGAGRVGEVFVSIASGYQCPEPPAFSPEHVRDHWSQINSTGGSAAPATLAEYNDFRWGIYESVVGR